MVAIGIALVAVAVGVMIMIVEVFAIWWLRRSGRPLGLEPRGVSDSPRGDSTTTPDVSILKPLCGLDDGLEENLESFARIEGVRHELIASVADATDPAVQVFERVCLRHPDAPFRLTVGGISRGPLNPKVERLREAKTLAHGRILFISDANVRVEPSDIASTVAVFDDPGVGCVSNLFTGEGASNLGAALESLHLLTFVAAGNALAGTAGVTCVVGKSMAVRATALETIGGFAAFEKVLAEDQAIGLALRREGWKVLHSPVTVRNVIVRRSLTRALARQVRWNRLRWSFSRFEYASEFLKNPFPMSVLATAAAPMVSPSATAFCAAAAMAIAVLRVAQAVTLARLTGSKIPGRYMVLAPLQDLLQFVAQFAPFVSNRIRWKEHELRIGKGSRIEAIESPNGQPPSQAVQLDSWRATRFLRRGRRRASAA